MNTITDVELLDAAKRFAAQMGNADDNSYKLGFLAGGGHVRKRLLQQASVMRAESRTVAAVPTDEQIDELYPIYNSSGTFLDYNACRREAAKQIRDMMLGGGNGA